VDALVDDRLAAQVHLEHVVVVVQVLVQDLPHALHPGLEPVHPRLDPPHALQVHRRHVVRQGVHGRVRRRLEVRLEALQVLHDRLQHRLQAP